MGKKCDHAGDMYLKTRYYTSYSCFNSKQTKALDNQPSRNPKKSKYKIDASCVKYFFFNFTPDDIETIAAIACIMLIAFISIPGGR